MNTIIAAATISEKTPNCDAAVCFRNSANNLYGVALADGIGNNRGVDKAADWVVNFMAESLSHSETDILFNPDTAFSECKRKFAEVFSKETTNNQFGTTLLTAVTYTINEVREIYLAYAGNGAIWHVKGNFNQFPQTQLFPWSVLNYLNPHSVLQDGKEVLTSCISPVSQEAFAKHTSLRLSSATEFGDIIMICSDGVFSNDKAGFSHDATGEIWVRYGKAIEYFLYYMDQYFREYEYSDESLHIILEKYLQRLLKDGFIDDDATLAVIITPEALKYQNEIRNEQSNKYNQ